MFQEQTRMNIHAIDIAATPEDRTVIQAHSLSGGGANRHEYVILVPGDMQLPKGLEIGTTITAMIWAEANPHNPLMFDGRAYWYYTCILDRIVKVGE